QVNGVVTPIADFLVADGPADYRRKDMIVVSMEMKTIVLGSRRIMVQNQAPEPLPLLRTGSLRRNHRCLMTQGDAGAIFEVTGLVRYRLKIVNHQVVLLNGQLINRSAERPQLRLAECFPEVDPSRLSENKTQALHRVSYRKGQFQISLRAAHQNIDLSNLLQTGNHLERAAQMPISRTLNGVEYFHPSV